MLKQERQFEMSMDINKARHNDCLFKTNMAMIWKFSQYRGSLADGNDPSIFNHDGACLKRNAVNAGNDLICLYDHGRHTVP